MEGRNAVTHGREVAAVLEGPRPNAFFRHLLEAEVGRGGLLALCYPSAQVRTFDFKWLRGVHRQAPPPATPAREAFTGAHVDNVYMGRGTPHLLTMWTPLGDVSLDMGCLAVVEGSHVGPAFQQLQVRRVPVGFLGQP
jgi:hypothetical protein